VHEIVTLSSSHLRHVPVSRVELKIRYTAFTVADLVWVTLQRALSKIPEKSKSSRTTRPLGVLEPLERVMRADWPERSP
jgi:hypothetical protein